MYVFVWGGEGVGGGGVGRDGGQRGPDPLL